MSAPAYDVMSSLYLIRHGQAGPRDQYDLLSDTGRRQASLLGRYFNSIGLRFQAVFAGAMQRQKETAELVLEALPNAPPIQTDARWNEFSLEGLWSFLAPRLLAENEEFARNHALHLANPNVDRILTPCDVELIRTWVGDRVACEGIEPWEDFRRRVEAPLAELARYRSGEAIAVFTSATPIAIWSGLALELDERRIFKMAGVLFNSNFTSFRIQDRNLSLFTFNNTPHLTDAELRTFR